MVRNLTFQSHQTTIIDNTKYKKEIIVWWDFCNMRGDNRDENINRKTESTDQTEQFFFNFGRFYE